MVTSNEIKKWSILMVDNTKKKIVGSEQAKKRPALVLARLRGDKYIVAYITSKLKNFATHVPVELLLPSEIMLEQLDTVKLSDIEKVTGYLDSDEIRMQVKEKYNLSILSEKQVENKPLKFKRGNIIIFTEDSEDKKGVILQNNIGNFYGSTTIVFEGGEIKTIATERITGTLGFFQNLKKLEDQLKKII